MNGFQDRINNLPLKVTTEEWSERDSRYPSPPGTACQEVYESRSGSNLRPRKGFNDTQNSFNSKKSGEEPDEVIQVEKMMSKVFQSLENRLKQG